MKNYQHNAKFAGLLILLATITYIIGSALLETVFMASDLATEIMSSQNQIILGVLLQSICAFAVVGVAVFLYPLIKDYSSTQAIGYLSIRLIEGVLLLVSGIIALSLITVNETGTAVDMFSNLLITQSGFAYQLAMLALGIGSVPFCIFLFKNKLIPSWMSLSGVIGYIALILSAIVALFGYESLSLYLYIPGTIFEIVFPLWLIVKGLNTSTAPQSGDIGVLQVANA